MCVCAPRCVCKHVHVYIALYIQCEQVHVASVCMSKNASVCATMSMCTCASLISPPSLPSPHFLPSPTEPFSSVFCAVSVLSVLCAVPSQVLFISRVCRALIPIHTCFHWQITLIPPFLSKGRVEVSGMIELAESGPTPSTRAPEKAHFGS